VRDRPRTDRRRGVIRAIGAMVVSVVLVLLAMYIVGNITQATTATPTPIVFPTSPPLGTPTSTPVVQPSGTGTPSVKPAPTTTVTPKAATPTPTR
jgi:hypothetical protein